MSNPFELRGKTMLFGKVGSVYLCVHPATAPSNAEWEEWLRDVESAPVVTGLLAYTEGGGPNAAQRKRTAEMWERRGSVPPIAVVSPSSVIRAITTALNYFLSRPIRGFSPDELEQALSHLDLKGAQRAELRQALSSARDRLAVPERV